MMTDPIADMLNRIRNALQARHQSVEIPSSRLKLEIARILKEEGYIHSFKKIEENQQGTLRIYFRTGPEDQDVIEGLERVSRPGCRIYCAKDEIPKVLGGLGINILSTSKGVMTGRRAGKTGVGGEILCNIW